MPSEMAREQSMFLGGWRTVIAVPTILLAIVGWASSFWIEPPGYLRGGVNYESRHEGSDQVAALLDSVRQLQDLVTVDRLAPAVIGGVTGFFTGVIILSAFGRSGRRRRRHSSTRRGRSIASLR